MWDVKQALFQGSLTSVLCFTLTMWDVKANEEELMKKLTTFYLNYVGCKVRPHAHIPPL